MRLFASIAYVGTLGILAHVIGEALPRGLFSPERGAFSPKSWEKSGAIYEKLGIKKWKDILPDMSKICKYMLPKKVPAGARSERVDALVQETCVAEAVHAALCLFSPVIYCFWRNGWGVALSVIYALCNIPFIMIQRYNRPRLVALSERLKKREERKKANEGSGTVL